MRLPSSEVRVPDIGDFADVPVIEIHVAAGDEIAAEDPLVTLESDKATMDVPAPGAGVVKQLRVSIGDRVSEGSVLLTLESDGSAAEREGGVFGRPRPPPPPSGSGARATADGATSPRRPRRTTAEATATPRSWCSAPARAATPPPSAPPTGASDRAGGTLRPSRGGVPQRRLHPIQGAAARGAGHRGGRGDGRAGDLVRKPQVDLEALIGWKASVVDKLTGGLAGLAKQRKVEVVHGSARFTGPTRCAVGERELTFENCIIAAGSEAATIPGLPDDPRIIDSTGALSPGRSRAAAGHRRRDHRARDGDRVRRARRQGDGRGDARRS